MQLFNGGKDAKEAARKSGRLQEIANLRQQSAVQASDTATAATRRSPRGRRLFVTDASQKNTLG